MEADHLHKIYSAAAVAPPASIIGTPVNGPPSNGLRQAMAPTTISPPAATYRSVLLVGGCAVCVDVLPGVLLPGPFGGGW